MQSNLNRRVSALEAKPTQTMGRAHRIIVDGESKEAAQANYEAAQGVKVADGDLVVFRSIID